MSAIALFPPSYLTPALNQNEGVQQFVEVAESKPQEIIPAPVSIGKTYSREALTSYLEATFTEYGIEDQIEIAKKVIQCESGWNVLADNGISYGIFQFTKPTWHDYGYGDIFDPYVQIETMARMWSMGLQKRWDCYRMLQ